MELELTRIDYTIVGVTNMKCMKLLPKSEDNLQQKIAVGDEDGVFQIFTVKKGEIQTMFKTVFDGKISRMELGGAPGTPRDKIFVSSESEVKGFTKRGKQFLGFDTNLTEPIKSMYVVKYVEGSDLLICGKNTFHHYEDCKDANYLLCGDRVNDVIALNSEKTKCLTPILACDDRLLRILENSSVIHSVPIKGSPTVLHLFNNDGGPDGDEVLYGTRNGGVGLLKVTGNEVKDKWLIEPNEAKDVVTCLDCYDLTGSGVNDIIVGRADGLIEVYSLDETNEAPKRIFSYSCNESINALQGGIVGTNGFHEVVVLTFSGWLFGLTTEALGKNLTVTADSGYISMSQEMKQKVNRLRDEVAELEQRLAKEREIYQTVIQDSENSVSAIPLIAVNDKFYLNKEDASYNLCLEVQTSIDNVLIQSDVPVDLLDVDKNSAVISFSDCNPTEGNFLLATYRCQLNTTRLDLKIRTIEGQYGTLQIYITPNIQPKSCQLREYSIKTLSMHVRCHNFDPYRPYNRLKLRGGFSLCEIHSWIEFCLPEVPEKPPTNGTSILIFTSAFIGTMLRCTYAKGEAEFESDNISTISILKDFISKQATKNVKNRNIDITWEINESSVRHTLDLLRPKLEHQLDLVKKMSILQSLSELDLSQNPAENSSLLTDEYSLIISNEKQIIKEFHRQPAYLDRLYGMVKDLFMDKHKFRGANVKNKVSALIELLEKEKYSYDELLRFFDE